MILFAFGLSYNISLDNKYIIHNIFNYETLFLTFRIYINHTNNIINPIPKILKGMNISIRFLFLAFLALSRASVSPGFGIGFLRSSMLLKCLFSLIMLILALFLETLSIGYKVKIFFVFSI